MAHYTRYKAICMFDTNETTTMHIPNSTVCVLFISMNVKEKTTLTHTHQDRMRTQQYEWKKRTCAVLLLLWPNFESFLRAFLFLLLFLPLTANVSISKHIFLFFFGIVALVCFVRSFVRCLLVRSVACSFPSPCCVACCHAIQLHALPYWIMGESECIARCSVGFPPRHSFWCVLYWKRGYIYAIQPNASFSLWLKLVGCASLSCLLYTYIHALGKRNSNHAIAASYPENLFFLQI